MQARVLKSCTSRLVIPFSLAEQSVNSIAIGGVPGSCSEKAACIAYAPTTASEFQFCCLSDNDMVTLNGKRITVDDGMLPTAQ
jgi:hypothetical protein